MSALATVLLSDALHAAHARRASDLHLIPSLPPVLRIDGKLEPWEGPGFSAEDLAGISVSFLDEAQRELLQRSGDVTATIVDAGVPVRIHAHRTGEGTAFALRFLAQDAPSFAELDLPCVVAELSRRPHGLIILGGPTGSGKSTTLASLVALINDESSRKIIMIEDPIEYRIRSKRSIIVQRQVGRDVPTFSQAVIGALRSDPDVIVIGEMREPATTAAAIAAAETGHLVLATLHAGDAAQGIDRLVDAFPAERMEYARARLAQVLLGIVAQRLVERASGTGRRAAAEVLVATDAVRHMIRDGKQHQLPTVMATGRQFGMQTLSIHLSELVSGGQITAATARRAIP
ncbi:MAG TPA: PilT/PilU family type 4a pilus ATPase [Candidatus Tyrphobacter sp.]